MKKVLVVGTLAVATFLAVLAFSYSDKATDNILKIGEIAPGLSVMMTDVSDKEIALKSAAKKNGLLVIFNSNLCPFVVGNGSIL